MEEKFLKNKKLFQIISLIFIFLGLTLGMLGLFHYNGVYGEHNVSAYTFAGDSSHQQHYIDEETKMLARIDQTDSGEYASKILITTERSVRTGETTFWAVVLEIGIVLIAVLLVADLVISIIRFFSFYQNKMHGWQIFIKISEALVAVIILVAAAVYIGALKRIGVATAFSLGFSPIVLVGLLTIQLVLTLFLIICQKRGKDLHNKPSESGQKT